MPNRFEPGLSQKNGVTLHRLPAYFEITSPAQIALRHLRRSVERAKPDIIHLHGATGALAVQGLRAASRSDTPIVVDSHQSYADLLPMSVPKHLYYRSFRHLVHPIVARRVEAWLAISPDAENLLQRELGVPRASILQMFLGTTIEEPPPRKSLLRFRSDHGIGSESLVAIFAGRITPSKRLELLFAALGDERLENEWIVVLVGPIHDEYKERLVAPLSPSAARRVLFAGDVDQSQLRMWLRASDVGVWPGAPGVTILQGMAAGLPLLLQESDATRPYLDGNGFSFGGQGPEIATLLHRLGTETDLRESMGRASSARARAVFSWMNLADRSLRIYRRILNDGGPEIPRLW